MVTLYSACGICLASLSVVLLLCGVLRSGAVGETGPGVGEMAAFDVVAHQFEGVRVIAEGRRGVAEPAMQVGPDGPDAVRAGQRRIGGQLIQLGERRGWPG